MKPRALALDIGSTRMKLAALLPNGALRILAERAFPAYSGKGRIRESDPISFRDRIGAMFEKMPDIAKDCPLGLSVQRSSFLLWDRETGRPLTKIVSWQDRRAEDWCQQRRNLRPLLWQRTGLPLSPHYAGPKLAVLLETQPWLAKMAARGKCCFGTLDVYLMWHWSEGKVWEIEAGMAVRTLLLELDSGDWDAEILHEFAIPREVLPEVVQKPSPGCMAPGGWQVQRIVPDQTAAVEPMFHVFPDAAVLNAGTGTFILRQAKGRAPLPLITIPRQSLVGELEATFWEGTVNAGAALWNRWKAYVSVDEPCPEGHFAAPEEMGWAAPYWRGDLGQICTGPELSLETRANLFMEGYVFRLRQILEAVWRNAEPQPLILGGGLAMDDTWVRFVAKRLPWTVHTLSTLQLSLWGAGWQADGRQVAVTFQPQPVQTQFEEVHNARYQAWSQWMDGVAGAP